MFSIWEKQSFSAEPDLLVIGAGITGSFAALHYKRRFPHHHVLLLERGQHPSGASVKNAGFACFGSPSEILADMDAEGEQVAVARVAERWAGLCELRAELGDEHIGFEPSGGYEFYPENSALYTRVADRFDALNRALLPVFGRTPYAWASPAQRPFGAAGDQMAHTDLEGAVDSGALMRTLIHRIKGSGVEHRFGQSVVALDNAGARAEVLLASGDKLLAKQVIVATNGYLRELLPHSDVVPARGQVLLTGPIPGLRLKGTFHMEEGYFYFRDHQGGVLLGGGRHLDKRGETTTEDAVTPLVQQALERLLADVILPGRSYTVAHRWSGVMGFRTSGKSPLIERISPTVTVAAGLSGMGVAIGIRVARSAVDQLVKGS
ncbi:MAG: FAD-binding oxidoreductase [Flavobacteriales bacterium]|nr:FAD-binding oxidoreductase [Flavobacteriales bacterium]